MPGNSTGHFIYTSPLDPYNNPSKEGFTTHPLQRRKLKAFQCLFLRSQSLKKSSMEGEDPNLTLGLFPKISTFPPLWVPLFLFIIYFLLKKKNFWGFAGSCWTTWAVRCSALVSLVAVHGLSGPTRNQTHVPCIARQILNHWATREVLMCNAVLKKWFCFFIFGCTGSLLVLELFSCGGEWEPLSSCRVWASYCIGFSCEANGL